MNNSTWIYCLAVLSMFCGAPIPANALVRYVNQDSTQAPFDGSSFSHGFKTITQGLNVTTIGDEVWVAKGTYVENVVLGDRRTLRGGFSGVDTTDPNSAIPSANATVIDGSNGSTANGAAVTIPSGARNCFVTGFTIQAGSGRLNSEGIAAGGGIFAEAAFNLAVDRCAFQQNSVDNNRTGYGGAIYYAGADFLSIYQCVFTNNSASQGGAIYLKSGYAAITLCQFSGNHCTESGGAIALQGSYVSGSAITNNVFHNNSAGNAGEGGAISLSSTSGFTIDQNTFTANSAMMGGAINIRAGDCMYVFSNTFDSNTASLNGGSIAAGGTACIIIFSNVINHSAAKNPVTGQIGSGGGIFVGTASVINNTVVNSVGGGLSVTGSSKALLANNLVAFNDAGIENRFSTAALTLNNNDAFGNTAFNYSLNGDQTTPSGNLSTDPLFVDFANGNLHLQPSSPCIEAGNSQDTTNSGAVVDFEYEKRVMGLSVDIGADEALQPLVFVVQPGTSPPNQPLTPHPVVEVRDAAGNRRTDFNGPVTMRIQTNTGALFATLSGTTTVNAVNGLATFGDLSIDKMDVDYQLLATQPAYADAVSAPFGVYYARAFASPSGSDENDGVSWATAKRTIASAISVMGGRPGEVWAATGTYTGPVTIPNDITVYGGFEGTESQLSARAPGRRSTLSGNNAGPCVRFVASSGNGIDGFRLTDGTGQFVQEVFLPVHIPAHREGGAIYIDGASPRISNNFIFQNSATWGGAICATGGQPDIAGNVITRNGVVSVSGLAGAGGAILMRSGVLSDNLIYENLAGGSASNSASYGAALVVGPAKVRNNTFVGNRGPSGQGDIVIIGSATFTNNIIKNVSAIAKEGRSNPTFSHNNYVPGASVTNEIISPVGTNGNIGTNPVFVNQAGDDYHLPAGSFLIDAGDASVLTPREKDMDGEPRLMGANVDIGADEATVAIVPMDGAGALALAGGLQAVFPPDLVRYDLESPPGLDLLDAVRLARKAAGLEPNP